MKKLINRLKNYHPCKPLALLYLLLPIAISFFSLRIIDNDFWFLINTGRYLTEHPFPTIEPFTIHNNLSFVIQQWLTDVIFYGIYHTFGHLGIIILMFIMNILIMYLIYKICMLISDNRLSLSIIITNVISFLLLIFYIRTRPQIFDFAILLTEIYLLEKYIREKKNKYLLFLPVLSLLLINLHASSWFMLFLFMLPYLIDSFKFKIGFLKGEGYKKKKLFLILIPMFLVGFLNPYTIKAITYIFTSFGDKCINSIVNEMKPMFKIGLLNGSILLLTITIVIVTNIIKHKNIKVRYLCLQLGTLLLGLQSAKGFSFLLIGGIFPLAYYYKDNFKKYKEEYNYSKEFKLKYASIFIIVLFIPLLISLNTDKVVFQSNNITNITAYLDKNVNKDKVILYTDYDTGGYLEWHQYKVYLDPRAEIFLKSNNKQKDILYEYYDLQHNKLKIEDFINHYNFTHFIVYKDDVLYNYLKNNKDYKLLYKEESKTNKKVVYYLFEKKDIKEVYER